MKITVLVNRGSGTVVNQGLTAESLRETFQKAGTEADVRLIPGEEICDAAREAVANGAEAVVAGGGDGTIRAVASVLVGGKVPLGVLPVGTLNHFARDLGIPTDLEAAARMIPEGQVRSLDVGEVNGEIFINNSGLGFYPPVVKVRDQERRELDRNKWVATISALFKVLPKMHTLHLRIKADGIEVRRMTRFVFVGNNEYQMSAFNYGARDRFDSGDLYLYISKSRTRLALVGVALLGLFRDVTRTGHFDSFRLPEFTVETERKALPVYLDGEVTVITPPLHYRVRPCALPVILPPLSPTPPRGSE
jgi:diacylglycerol kinase family enzyme